MTRRRYRWGLVAAVAVLPTLLLIWLVVAVVRFMTSDYPLGGGPEKASCDEALAFGGAALPDGAHDTDCTVQTWLDTDYRVTFRMPRDGVVEWLRRTYPAERPRTDFCDEGADLCLHLNSEDHPPPAGAGANAVTVDVTYESTSTARVRFSAFTV
ncbi:hypothetical protein AB0E88_25630 [Streptomyces sp. NPDC028635]|uniref:hypothetical protein n=1 Tax=Streptomyces sp. NPDC028635 TaxID=3154800 RepID=UPI0033FD173E